jgi:YidC/Oxa1 family membrane protein insertase
MLKPKAAGLLWFSIILSVLGFLELKTDSSQWSALCAKLESRQSTDDMNIIGFTSPVINVPAGTSMEVDATFYSGPKVQSELKI